MYAQKYGKIMLLVLLAVQISTAATFRVAQDGSAGFTTIQSAVDAASGGDIIIIEDVATYNEQVTIDSTKSGLTLQSANPTGNKKPVIKFQDKIHVLPKTFEQAQHGDSINFDQNGALRIMRARNITINGIRVDGGGPAPFAYPGIWNRKDPLFHGNAALCLYIAGDVVVKNCEFVNAYFGVNVKDRNEGGIFANANPADIEPWNVVPLSGFGKTGNHIFEDNKIHNNSWGMFFESTWDLGSVIRYNLFYENHHTPALAAKVAGMEDGANQAGGALFFKDMLLSPLAIYNNTFWHNYVVLGGHWQASYHHLIFNNIVAEPFEYYKENEDFPNPYTAIDPAFPNRMHNSLYAAQEGAPQVRKQKYQAGAMDEGLGKYIQAETTFTAAGQIRIMNGMDKVEIAGQKIVITIPLSTGALTETVNAEWAIQPGAAITTFASGSNVRWFEMKFLSTDTSSPDFLVPDWDDPDVARLVVDKGWVEAGIRDADGSIADLGARPKSGRATNQLQIKPISPVFIKGTTATTRFNVTGLNNSSLSNLRVKYIRWINNLTYQKDIFGPAGKALLASDIVEVTVPATPIQLGSNTLEITIPSRKDTDLYGFFEVILEGENAEGITEATSVGFLPYRKVDYEFEVKVLNLARTKELDTVKAGEPVILSIVPKRIGDGQTFDNRVSKVDVSLGSSFPLINTSSGQPLTIDYIEGQFLAEVMFIKVPNTNTDFVSASGSYEKSIFQGSSDAIVVLPGAPEKVTFQDPASNTFKKISSGIPHPVTLKVEDKYGNAAGIGEQVTLKSTRPNVGDVLNTNGTLSGGMDVISTTDVTGIATFNAIVTEGDLNDTCPLVASLVSKPGAIDNAGLIVGQAKPRFFIIYGETTTYDSTIPLRGCAGQKFPVTIIASLKGDSILTDLNNSFDIQLGSGIAVYETSDPSDTTRITFSALVEGKKTVWIKSIAGQQVNRSISVSSRDDNAIAPANRAGIYFDLCGPVIDHAAYFSDNGDGQVDRLDIWYKETIKSYERPDSFELYWPEELPTFRKVVVKTDETFVIDPNDSTHLIVRINDKFAPKMTSSNKTKLGTSFWNDRDQQEAPTMKNPISIQDSVGPVLLYASVVEKIGSGNDTMRIRFSEYVDLEDIYGITLSVIKPDNSAFNLNILNVLQLPGSDTLMLIVEDALQNSPKYGDSLKILAEGTITDYYGNKAHSDNRPVPIFVKYVPADIVHAYYLDTNADGFVDQVNVKFDKFVGKEFIYATCTWSDGNNSTQQLTSESFFYNPLDSNMIIMNVAGKFGVEKDVKTSGAMTVTVNYTGDFEGTQRITSVADSAAPVLVKAEYFPGELVNDREFSADKIKMTFSEDVQYQFPTTLPFRFFRGNGEYTISLKLNTKQIERGFEFELLDTNSIQGVRYPENGDSVQINCNAQLFPFSDRSGNYQIVEANRKVSLYVKPSAVKFEIKVGPNPFVVGSNNPIKIEVVPKAKMVENVIAEGKIVIYDKLGNIVYQAKASTNEQPENSDKRVKLEWRGFSKSGRKVSEGTYLMKVMAKSYDTVNNVSDSFQKTFPIGAKKE